MLGTHHMWHQHTHMGSDGGKKGGYSDDDEYTYCIFIIIIIIRCIRLPREVLIEIIPHMVIRVGQRASL